MAALVRQSRISDQCLFLVIPAFNLVNTAPRIFIKRNLVRSIVQITLLDEERIIFGIMFTGFCAVVAKTADILEANHIMMFFQFVLEQGQPANLRVQVLAVLILDLQQPAHVVDSGDQFLPLVQVFFMSMP